MSFVGKTPLEKVVFLFHSINRFFHCDHSRLFLADGKVVILSDFGEWFEVLGQSGSPVSVDIIGLVVTVTIALADVVDTVLSRLVDYFSQLIIGIDFRATVETF